MDVDTAALRWFQQVADGATVTQVSILERVTQPGVSRALARLEAEVGTGLLHRSGRTLRMTRAGVAFKRHVDAMLHELDDGLAAVDQLIDPETGTVTLGMQLSFGTWLVPDLIRSFRAEHPGVRFALRQLRDELGGPGLDDQMTDLAITSVRSADPAIEFRRLMVEPLHLAVPAGHRLAARSGVELADVAAESFVALRRTSLLRQLADGLCVRAGFRPQVGFEGDDLPTVRGLVGAGLGVAIVPPPHADAVVGDETTAGVLRHLAISDPGASREVGLAWSTERPALPAAALFREHVLDRARRDDLPTATGWCS